MLCITAACSSPVLCPSRDLSTESIFQAVLSDLPFLMTSTALGNHVMDSLSRRGSFPKLCHKEILNFEVPCPTRVSHKTERFLMFLVSQLSWLVFVSRFQRHKLL